MSCGFVTRNFFPPLLVSQSQLGCSDFFGEGEGEWRKREYLGKKDGSLFSLIRSMIRRECRRVERSLRDLVRF